MMHARAAVVEPDLFDMQFGSLLGDWSSSDGQSLDPLQNRDGSSSSPVWDIDSSSQPLAVSHESTRDSILEDLFDDPAKAALVSSRVRQRKAAAVQANQSKPKAVTCKRTRAREKDKVESLETQLAGVLQKVNDLTLANEQLRIKNKVLNMLMECVEELESKAAQVAQDQGPTPSGCCESGKDGEQATPANFIAAYKRNLAESSKWVLKADNNLTQELDEQLSCCNNRALDSVYTLCMKQPQMMAQVKADMLKEFPLGMPEDQHWLSVIQSLELSEEQQELILVARDIFCACYHKVNLERESIGIALEAAVHPLESFNSLCNCDNGPDEELLLAQVLRTLKKQSSLTLVITNFLYKKIFTPLQAAKCALHAHPLLPSGIILVNAAAAYFAAKQKPL